MLYKARFILVNLMGNANPVGKCWWLIWENMSGLVMNQLKQCGQINVVVSSHSNN